MTPLAGTAAPAVVRTDFSDQAAWEALCEALQRPTVAGFTAQVELLEDRGYEGLSARQLLAAIGQDYNHSFIAIADEAALRSQEQALLVIDLLEEPGRELRAAAAAMWAVENNLSLANMSFEEFAAAVDGDGVFRGFPDSDV